MKTKTPSLILIAFLITAGLLPADELPVPSYSNSLVISLELKYWEDNFAQEVAYLKNNFDFGLYAWLCFSHTSLAPSLAWYSDWQNASNLIGNFKSQVTQILNQALDNQARRHIVLCDGLTRYLSVYTEAKQEDIRNCQWYNDNNLASDAQIAAANPMGTYIFGTLSRYARKLRLNLEAKARASLEYLKLKMADYPDTLVALSGWGEVELNFNRLNDLSALQTYFCDYSPFAVLEFRDWICHTGLYADGQDYETQGYSGGGALYQGSTGLAQFNQDFGTAFTTWDLKYFHWDLADDYDTDPTDKVNNDPHLIPYTNYQHGAMKPTEGTDYIAGGFDPPREMVPGNAFWDLWHGFRQALVAHFVADMAGWVSDSGIAADRWYSHQIPADYLMGTQPSDGPLWKNPRYWSSASTLAGGDIHPYGSLGATIYDVKFPSEIKRTTQYCLAAAAEMARDSNSDWACMEYDAETYPDGYNVLPSDYTVILDQYQNVYNHGPHLINFFKWLGNPDHIIKGTAKETALRRFVARVRDAARGDISRVFTPPQMTGVSGAYDPVTAKVILSFTGKIWTGQNWNWTDWGHFREFEIFRGTSAGFVPGTANRIGTATANVYQDPTGPLAGTYYYKVRAVNSEGIAGPASAAVAVSSAPPAQPFIYLSRSAITFGAVSGQSAPAGQSVDIRNLGSSGTSLNWEAQPQSDWISLSPSSGTGDGQIEVRIDHSGLSAGIYSGTIQVEDSSAVNSPQTLSVTLNVYTQGGDAAPFGSFDTPIAGSTVSGNVPVTGWALDDVGIEKVEIRRSPVSGDPPGVIGGDGLVYVGDAVFVRGARPDVEVTYPGYPQCHRAGWGYMLLTNFLPNQGNGTFTLHACASDSSGHTVKLGQKIIICNNAARILPFGTIDTPGQGGLAQGEAYINWGWALTPLPKTIPTDGHTIDVYIDGAPAGHPVYNLYREDIATLFPDYNNSQGAVGYFVIDTTGYFNGVHTISWVVTDNQGASDGCGSRYFEIQNTSGAAAAQAASGFRTVSQDLQIRLAGNSYREIQELERTVIEFETGPGLRLTGWGRNPGDPLPIGSSLDPEAGVFYWMPGPGFLGEFTLHFAATDGKACSPPVEVRVRIVPKRYPRASKRIRPPASK